MKSVHLNVSRWGFSGIVIKDGDRFVVSLLSEGKAVPLFNLTYDQTYELLDAIKTIEGGVPSRN